MQASSGEKFVAVDMEAAPGQNTGLRQDFFADAGSDLLIEISAALSGGAAGTAKLAVYWNGVQVGTVTPAATAFDTYLFNVISPAGGGTGADGSNRLEVREVGAGGDGLGTLVSSISVSRHHYDVSFAPEFMGSGVDTLDYAAEGGTKGVIVNLSEGDVTFDGTTVSSGKARDTFGFIDTIGGFSNYRTGSGNDYLVLGTEQWREPFRYEPHFRSVIATGAGNDVIVAGGGGDSIDAGTGTDSVKLDWSDLSASQPVVIDVNKPVNVTIGTGLGQRYLRGVEQLASLETGAGNDVITMSRNGAFEEQVITGAGNDILYLTANVFANVTDVGSLGTGYDQAVIDFSGSGLAFQMYDVTLRDPDDGLDVKFNVTGSRYNLHLWGLNRLTLKTGAGNDFLKGTAGNDVFATGGHLDQVAAGAGDDLIDGGTGADSLNGGAGNDTYVVDLIDDNITEASGQGFDSVRASVSYVLPVNVEALILTGSSRSHGTGNALANNITGNAAANVLNGAVGADTLTGGNGNDTYVVDQSGDRVIETSATGGIDTVSSAISYALGANLEKLLLTGAGAVNGIGNGLANTIIGNAAVNSLSGGAGDDRLDGAAGADTMTGGFGNDTYVAGAAGDRAVESRSDGGTDMVLSSTSFVLGSYLENLVLTGSGAINGTGNGLANNISGNSGANLLNGGAGADTLAGGNGNDTYVIDGALDKVTETSTSGGTADKVMSSVSYTLGVNVEQLALTGSVAVHGTGNTLANSIIGNGSANTLNGGAGKDFLTGGAGADKFLFATALSATTNWDDILDFSVRDDTIVLDRTIFTKILANGTLSSAAFVSGTAAADAVDRIIYDKATGNLFYDADGTGASAKILFAQVNAGLVLTNADFIAIA